jgi:hypothetical protein
LLGAGVFVEVLPKENRFGFAKLFGETFNADLCDFFGIHLHRLRLDLWISSLKPNVDGSQDPTLSVRGCHSGDIETIVARALEKEKTRRYGSTAELAADIRRYLHDEPIVGTAAEHDLSVAEVCAAAQGRGLRHRGGICGVGPGSGSEHMGGGAGAPGAESILAADERGRTADCNRKGGK